MSPVVDSIVYSIVASIIYDIGKYGLGHLKYKKENFAKENIEQYIFEKIGSKYEPLFDSGILLDFLKNPLITDTIHNYIIYVVSGKSEIKLFNSSISKKGKSKNLEKTDIVNFLAESLQLQYTSSEVVRMPDKNLIVSFFTDIITLSNDYILGQLTPEETEIIYFVNSKMNLFGSEIISKLDEIESILKQSIQLEVIYTNNEFLDDKKYYTKVLKDNHRMAHIYLLDKFDINEFYVPPFLKYGREKIKFGFLHPQRISIGSINRPEKLYNKAIFDGWKYIFERSNIIYITGGAGYGKSLFMKKLIGEYEELNIANADEYMIICGELKNFFTSNTRDPMPVVDFLQNSMKRETLIEDSRVSKELINYYLKRGRCIILLDALDEVDKERRRELHGHVVEYFKNQNPNNKVCITSRARGFLPEKNIEVFEIEPLDSIQIQAYVDNIIKLNKFDQNDKETFLQQTQVLVSKGFLNSFLVLSLLINIYKAERELPENKLELYQKCFEYISNKREKEKSQEKYDWTLISTLMKDNTFMELANLCLPNNSDVSKDKVIERLTEIYKTKYVSENQTELAIEEFLGFCSDRTELFVPASGDDCFKFFHRSFFEYFYSQYIFTRMSTVEQIYDAWRSFDVDSEIFELTLAMFKQKNESKYQEIIEFLLKKVKEKYNDNVERTNVMNMLVLCMQVIDDEWYKKQFVDFIVGNVEFCKNNIQKINNQEILINVIDSNKHYRNMVINRYGNIARYEGIVSFLKTYPEVERFLKQNKKYKGLEEEGEIIKYRFQNFHNYNFYAKIYFSNNTSKKMFENLSKADLFALGKEVGATTKEINKVQAQYKKYMDLKPDTKETIEKLLL